MSNLSDASEALIYSDLGGPYVHEGRPIEIILYRLPDNDWVVELSDGENASFVLEDLFPLKSRLTPPHWMPSMKVFVVGPEKPTYPL